MMKKSNLLKAFGLTALAAVSLGLFAFNGSVNAEDGATDASGDNVVKGTNPVLYLKKQMTNVVGYVPQESDTFKVQVKQIENEGQYWGKAWGETAPVAPKPELASDFTEITFNGSDTTDSVDAATKSVTQPFGDIPTRIDEPGIYTFELTEKTDGVDNVSTDGTKTWKSDGVKYILKVKAYKGESDSALQFEVTMNKLNESGKKLDKVDASSKGTTGAVFSNELVKVPTKNVKVSKFLTGTGVSQVSADKTYKIHVAVVLGTSEETITTDKTGVTAKYGATGFDVDLKAGETITLQNIPVGANVTVSESNLGSGFDANIAANSDAALESTKEAPKDDQFSATPEAVTAMVTNEDTNKNAFAVTNRFTDIVNTGLKFMTSPFVILLAMVVVAGGAYVVAKRKISE